MNLFQKGRAKMGLKRSKLPTKIGPKWTKNKKGEKKVQKCVKTCKKFPKID